MIFEALNKIEAGGLCYLEVPDGEAASKVSLIERQEFFVEHFYTFTKTSLKYLMEKVGLTNLEIHSIVDPSGKFTVYGFGKKELL